MNSVVWVLVHSFCFVAPLFMVVACCCRVCFQVLGIRVSGVFFRVQCSWLKVQGSRSREWWLVLSCRVAGSTF
jgi:hypothetical protein